MTQNECSICGQPISAFCDVCETPLCKAHARSVGKDTDVCPVHDNPEDIKTAIERRTEKECELDYETTYGHCLAKNPYWFIPDTECNSDGELLNWRHALFAVDQGVFEAPEHYFWKVVDKKPSVQETVDMMADCDALSMFGDEDGKTIVHGHNTPWGMGISAFSDKISVWETYPSYKWLLDVAKSDISDEAFLERIEERKSKLATQEND